MGRQGERAGCSVRKKSAPGLREDGSEALTFNFQGVLCIHMSSPLGVGAQVWLWLR